ncbi:hypothetical protein Taro_000696 [Colocasia esculenta]|uniref:Fibronectin type-III domain-containing protein n=1 Tax=Colocasia esculenta TaxID=4460 RepID=A0A843TDX2_COLES|nr:hypothetical protein [Colocasia esculenta]
MQITSAFRFVWPQPEERRRRGEDCWECGRKRMRSLGSDPALAGLVVNPSKCRMLSMEEKRDLVYELSKWKQGAPELLQPWSRKDLLEILCLEMGKERKYTGLTKYKIIEILLKIVSEKQSGKFIKYMDTASPPPPNPPPPSKRQRKNAHPCRLPVGTIHYLETNACEDVHESRYYLCQNLACRATISLKDTFCRRCSCCICYKYDDNKDPTLWLACGSEASSEGDCCGMSCHLECALKHEKSGIARSEHNARLDGSFCCVSCGKVNDFLGCWRKQLCVAKDARRVDILCYRVSLCHKLLKGTEKFQNLLEIVELAVKMLEEEVGAFDGLPIKMARGIVNRLSSGAEVQQLCSAAITFLDSMLSTASHLPPLKNQKSDIQSIILSFEDVSTTCLTVVVGLKEDGSLSEGVAGYSLWYQKADIAEYPTEPFCKLLRPKGKHVVTDLEPATRYMFKVVAFSNSSNLGEWEARVTTGSVAKDDTTNLRMTRGIPDMNCESPESNGSGLSNPSEGYESNNTAACVDQEKLPRTSSGCSEKPNIPDLEKALNSEDPFTAVLDKMNEDGKEEELPDHSVSAVEESNFMILTSSHKDSPHSTNVDKPSDILNSGKESYAAKGNEMVIIPYRYQETILPFTPSNPETLKCVGRGGNSMPGTNGQNCFPKPEKELVLSSTKNRSGARCEKLCNKDSSVKGGYEYCVKVVRWLECEGHIETNFRVKFLTWFSLRATPQERRVVSVFIDTMIDDPPSLAGQLIDTFSEGVHSKQPLRLPSGFCTKLWH